MGVRYAWRRGKHLSCGVLVHLLVVFCGIGLSDPQPVALPTCCGLEELPPASEIVAGPRAQVCPGEGDEFSRGVCGEPGLLNVYPRTTSRVSSAAGKVLINVMREGGFSGEATVGYRTVNITALSGLHYIPVSGRFKWKSSQGQNKSIAVELVRNFSYTPGSYSLIFGVQLFDATGAMLGPIADTNVTVINSNAKVGVLSMYASAMRVSEANKTAFVQVLRKEGDQCPASVSWRTVPSITNSYGHYQTEQNGTLSWEEGDGGTKTIAVEIFDNENVQGANGEWFFVEIFLPPGGSCAPVDAELYRTRVEVVDDDLVGVLGFEATVVEARSDQGTALVRVSRTGGASEPVSLNYVIEPLTARAGDDYEASNGFLKWAHGDMNTKEIKIVLKEDGVRGEELFRTLKVRLIHVVGTTIQGPSSAVVRVVDVAADSGSIGFAKSFVCRHGAPVVGGICYYAVNDETVVLVPVSREGGSLGRVTVKYRSENATATSGQDFGSVSGTLTWESDDSSIKLIEVPILNDAREVPVVAYMQLIIEDVSASIVVVDPARESAYVGLIEADGAGSIRVAAASQWVLKSVLRAPFELYREGGDMGEITAQYQTFSGTAKAGIDFVDTYGNVTWADGDSSAKQIYVDLIDDKMYRFGQYFTDFNVRVVNFSSNTFADPRFEVSSIYIANDNAVTGSILFDSTGWDLDVGGYVVGEGEGHIDVVVQRKNGLQSNLAFSYRTVDGTAVAGKHYVNTFGDLAFDEGNVTDKVIRIPIMDDSKFLVTRATLGFKVEIFNVSVFGNGLSVDTYPGRANVSANVEIVENDGPGVIRFDASNVRIKEDEGTVEVQVNRVGGKAGSVVVEWETVDGTAIAGSDFTYGSDTLTWTDNDNSPKTITIGITADGASDGVGNYLESFQVNLKNARGAYLLPAKSSTTVTISDVDGAGVLTVVPLAPIVGERENCCVRCSSEYSDSEKRWCAYFDVTRTEGSNGKVCADYSAVGTLSDGDLTASKHTHFYEVSDAVKTLCWEDGETDTKTNITVELRYHGTYDMLFKTFRVALSSDNASVVLSEGVIQAIEDEDANAGLVTFVPDSTTGLSIFQFSPTDSTAAMQVARLGGSDGDLTIEYETELVGVNFHESTELPIAIKAPDGTGGNNVFCLANERVEGSCADSSSAVLCDAKSCTSLVSGNARRAEEASDFSGGGAASFIKLAGSLTWKDGDSDIKGISIPLLHTKEGGSLPIYRAFRVNLKSAELSNDNYVARRFSQEKALPGDNSYGGCSETLCAEIESDEVARCSPHTCRRITSSQSYVLVEVDIGQGNFRLINTTYFVKEGQVPKVSFSVERVGGTSGEAGVEYSSTPAAVVGLSVAAMSNVEFNSTSGLLKWADGERGIKEFHVPVIDDDEYVRGRMKRSLSVELTSVNQSLVLEGQQNATLVIVDDDAQTGFIQMLESKKTVSENQGAVRLRVGRIGGQDSDVHVNFFTGVGSRWNTVVSQDSTSSAHPRFFSEQSYACLSTLEGRATENFWQTVRNTKGGDGALAFDFDNSTYWDASETDTSPDILELTYEFAGCVAGAAVSSYSLASTGIDDDWCPGAWEFLGSNDGQGWAMLDTRASGVVCDPQGSTFFTVGSPAHFRYYKFAFSRDVLGRSGVKVAEAKLRFEGQGDTGLLLARVCNSGGECCQFERGVCDDSTGHRYQELLSTSHDFTYAFDVLSWLDGDNSTKDIVIPLINDCMGCTQETCDERDQFQDKVHETFNVQLTLATDVQIRQLANDTASVFPFRKDPGLSKVPSVVTILDDDGPGSLALVALSCGPSTAPHTAGPQAGTSVPPFVRVDGSLDPGLDSNCPILESAGTAAFMVTRSGQGRGPISVAYTVNASISSTIDNSSTAVDGVDFEEAHGALHWSHNDTAPKYFSVLIRPTQGYENGRYVRTFQARLHSVLLPDGSMQTAGGAEISQCGLEVAAEGSSTVCLEPGKESFEVQIVDQDAVPGTIRISRSDLDPEVQYGVDESTGTVSITVERVGGKDLPLTVSYSTTSITTLPPFATACPGPDCDYVPVNGTLRWDDQDDTIRTIDIQIVGDTKVEAFETFKLVITGQVSESIPFCGGYAPYYSKDGDVPLGRKWHSLNCGVQILSEATITIRDSLNSGYFELLYYDSPYVVSDDKESANVAILRKGGSGGIAAVQVETYLPSSARAVAGQHFSPTQVQKQWYDSDAEAKVFSVPIIKRTVPSNTVLDFYVRLTWVSSNAAVNQLRKVARVLIRSSVFVARFQTQMLTESSLVADEDNKLTFQFRLNTVLSAGGTFTLTGLTGSQTHDSNALPITGTAAEIFGNTAEWVQATGKIVFTVADDQMIDFGVNYAVSFVVRNSATSQSPVVPTVSVAGGMACVNAIVQGKTISCTETVTIFPTSVSAGDGILSASLGSFTVSQKSSLCRYVTVAEGGCKPSVFFGAYNFIRISLKPTVALPSGSHITISGLGSSPTPGSTVQVALSDMIRSPTGEAKSSTAECICYAPKCSCGHTFTGIPKAGTKLQIFLQCNAYGWGSSAGQYLNVGVGFDTIYNESYPSSGNPFVAPPSTCEDNCGNNHELFTPSDGLPVDDMIQDEALFVSLSSDALVDFCGLGEFLNANLTLTWTTVAKDVEDVTAAWNRAAGTLTFDLPEGLSIGTTDPVAMTLYMRNPETASSGSILSVTAIDAVSNGQLGPTRILEDVALVATTRASLIWASLEESTPVQGALNQLVLQFRFNGDIGGTVDGTWVTVTGLQGSETPSDPALPLSRCTTCADASASGLALADVAGEGQYSTDGTGSWNSQTGELIFFLRGPPPTYHIPEQNLVALLGFTNPTEARPPALAENNVVFSNDLVAGSGLPANAPFRSEGVGTRPPVFSASISMQVFPQAIVDFGKPIAYTVPKNISFSLKGASTFNSQDEITVRMPMLTSCNVLCDDGVCLEMGCHNISGIYVPVPPTMHKAGGDTNFFVMRWVEDTNSFVFKVQGGHAACVDADMELLVRPEDYGCYDFDCALKLLPTSEELIEGSASVSTSALACPSEVLYCTNPETVPVDTGTKKIDISPGTAWGQFAAMPDDDDARGWFSLQEHDGYLYQLGGLGTSGLDVNNFTRSSIDGKVWAAVALERSGSVFPRFSFTTLSFEGSLYIIGGLISSAQWYEQSADVYRWESARWAGWLPVTAKAQWPWRYDHAAVVHAGSMWIMGGVHQTFTGDQLLSDVWNSRDGVRWTQLTSDAAFGGLRGHAAASFGGKLWVYGGEGDQDQPGRVWYSYQGKVWNQTMPQGAPWASRRLAHAGLVFSGRLWVVGGYSRASGDVSKAYSDVWWSDDGDSWYESTENTPGQFGERFGAVAAAFNRRLWYIGGSSTDCPRESLDSCTGLSGEAEGNASALVCRGYRTTCGGRDIWGDVYSTATFLDLSIDASSPVMGADNMLTLRASLDQDMVAGDSFIISGLNCTSSLKGVVVSGPSTYLFMPLGRLDAFGGSVTLVLNSTLSAGETVDVSFTVVNSVDSTVWSSIQVTAASVNFFSSVVTPRVYFAGNESPQQGSVLFLGQGPERAMTDGGVVFDVEAHRSVYISEIVVDIQLEPTDQPVKQDVSVFYKAGPFADSLHNLSEWRFLGSVTIDPSDATYDMPIKLSDLSPEGRGQGNASSLTTFCQASATHHCGSCNTTSCECNEAGPTDKWPFPYEGYTFCEGETYCPEDGVEGCYCTSGNVHECTAGSDEASNWLGPQETWIEDTEKYVSSWFERTGTVVDVIKVAQQDTPAGLWHSGEPGGQEAGCPDLPLCPPDWPFDKDQWLAFDMGICHSISGFRTLHPDYTYWRAGASPRLQYSFKGTVRENMAASERAEEHWNNAHYKDFEVQWSPVGLDGPWITAFGGRAVVKTHQEGFQDFKFFPVSARYWRLRFLNNYGFGYMMTSAVEFYGQPSVWCQQSEFCNRALECRTDDAQSYATAFSLSGKLERQGLGIAAGTHSLYVRGSLGLRLIPQSGRRGDIVSSDGIVAIKLGARLDYRPPVFAWQARKEDMSFGQAHALSRQGATDAILTADEGFVVVTRFTAADVNSADGTLLAIGEICEGGISIVVESNAIIVQGGGCTNGVPNVRSAELVTLSSGTDYCYAASIKSGGKDMSHYLEKQFPLLANGTVSSTDEATMHMLPLITGFNAGSKVFVGGSDSCGNNPFVGAMSGASIYAGQLSDQGLKSACRRKCDSVHNDGGCYQAETVKEEQSLNTSFASGVTTMRLPVAKEACHSSFRLSVGASTGESNGTWCLKRLLLYGTVGPRGKTIDLVDFTATASSSLQAAGADFAFAQGFDGYYCASDSGPGWLQVSLPGKVCVMGYGLQATEETQVGSPSSWVLEGGKDDEPGEWLPLHTFSGATFRQLQLRKFVFEHDHGFMFVTNMYHDRLNSIGVTYDFGYSTLSNLYKWAGDDQGWSLVQQIPTRGARSSVHYVIQGKHYLAIASSRDGDASSISASKDGRMTDTQVGSDIFLWDGSSFVIEETIPTNISKSIHYFENSGKKYLVSSDQRLVVGGEQPCMAHTNDAGCRDSIPGALEDGEHSILFEYQSPKSDITRDTIYGNPEAGDFGNCNTCACASMFHSVVTASGVSSGSDADMIIDGDDSTLWTGLFDESKLASQTTESDTADFSLALEISFDDCQEGADVIGYTLVSAGSDYGCPSRWLFQGFKSGSWETLDDRTDYLPTGAWPPTAPRGCPNGRFQTFWLPGTEHHRILHGNNTAQKYRFLFYPMFGVETGIQDGTGNVTLAEVEFVFGNSANNAFYHQPDERFSFGSTLGYRYHADGPPFWSTYMDNHYFPVASLIDTNKSIDLEGIYGDFAVEMKSTISKLVGADVCDVELPEASGFSLPVHLDPTSIFRACSYASDYCNTSTNGSASLCFGDTGSAGICGLGSFNLGAECDSDSDCGGGMCVENGKYMYKISFKKRIRMLRFHVRGCSMCGRVMSVLNGRGELVSERESLAGCEQDVAYDCGSMRVEVNYVDREFYIMETNHDAAFQLLSSISFEYEPFGQWEVAQLIPTMGAMDFEHFQIAGESYLAVANYKTRVDCYGMIECISPEGSQPASPDTHLPHNIHSHILKLVDGSYVRVQNISTFGALDWEHFVISGEHYLVIANSFDASFSTVSAPSVVYKWADPEFVEYQSIPTKGARKWRYFLKDHMHHLALLSSAKGTEAIEIYRWDGTVFARVGSADAGPKRPTDVALFVEDSATYLAVTSFTSEASLVYRFHDATTWRGGVKYSDAYSPSANFVLRIINGTTLNSYADSVLTITLRPDRTLQPGTVIRIGGILTDNGKPLSETDTTSNLPLSGPNSSALGSSAVWNRESGELNVTTVSPISHLMDTVVSLRLRTPRVPGNGAIPYIWASGPVTVPRAMMTGRILAVEEDNLSEFADSFISETCPDRGCDYNVIRVRLRASKEMPAGTVIIVRNLLGSRTGDGYLEVTGPGAKQLATSSLRYPHSGNWSQTNGTITLALADRALPPYEYLDFSFALKNGHKVQIDPSPTVEAIGGLKIPSQPLRCALETYEAKETSQVDGEVCPVMTFYRSSRWLDYAIADSHTKLQALNTFTVTLRPSAPLLEDDEITISGLSGTQNPDSVFPLTGEHAHRFRLSRLTFSASGKLINLKVGPNCVVDCSDGDCVEPTGKACIFPFVYNGQQKLSCLSDGSPNPSKEWCVTSFPGPASPAADTPGWGYCSCTHTIPSDSPTIFSFQIRNPQTPQSAVTPRIAASGSVSVPLATLRAAVGVGTVASVLSASTQSMKATLSATEILVSDGASHAQLEELELTVELWVLGAPLSSGDHVDLVHLGDMDDVMPLLRATSTSVVLSVNTTNGLVSESANLLPSADEWQHWAVTWSGATATAEWYLDGVSSSTASFGNAGDRWFVHGGSKVIIGGGSASSQLSVADVRIWNIARSSAAIKAQHTKFFQISRMPASLIAYYTFDGCDGAACNDLSRSGREAASHSLTVSAMMSEASTQFLSEHVYARTQFTVLEAQQTSDWPGGDNCVQLNFTVNTDIGPGATLTVSGLAGSQTPSGNVPITFSGPLVPLATYGFFNRDDGTFSMRLMAPLHASENCLMTFSLINPAKPQVAQRAYVSLFDGNIQSSGDTRTLPGKATVVGAGVLFASDTPSVACTPPVPDWEGDTCPTYPMIPGHDATCDVTCPSAAWRRYDSATTSWLATSYISESDVPARAGASTTLTVRLQPDRLLPPGSSITVAGLNGTQTSSRSASSSCAISGKCFLQVSGQDAEKFDLTDGSWTNEGGSLVLTLAKAMKSDRQFIFSFVLVNSQTATSSGFTPSVSISGDVTVPPVYFCLCNNCSPLLNVMSDARIFFNPTISESTCEKCRSTNFSVSLKPLIELSSGTTVTLSGLGGTLTPSGQRLLNGTHAEWFQDQMGEWHQDGNMVLTVGASPVPAETTIEFSFVLHAGRMQQDVKQAQVSFRTPDHDENSHGDVMQVPVIGSIMSFGGSPGAFAEPTWPLGPYGNISSVWLHRSTVERNPEVYRFTTMRYMSTTETIQESASETCCLGACCVEGTCCSCNDLHGLARAGMTEFWKNGLFSPGSPCEMHCEFDLSSSSSSSSASSSSSSSHSSSSSSSSSLLLP